jgi:uncharacterized protein (UPF0335 family)
MAKHVGDEEPTDVRVVLGIAKGRLKALLNKMRGYSGEISEVKEHIQELMNLAVDKDHAHPAVVKLVLKLDGMDAIKRNEYLYHFDICRGHMGWDTSDLLREETSSNRRIRDQVDADEQVGA